MLNVLDFIESDLFSCSPNIPRVLLLNYHILHVTVCVSGHISEMSSSIQHLWPCFNLLSTVQQKSLFLSWQIIDWSANIIFTITAEILARSLANFYHQYADRHMNLNSCDASAS